VSPGRDSGVEPGETRTGVGDPAAFRLFTLVPRRSGVAIVASMESDNTPAAGGPAAPAGDGLTELQRRRWYALVVVSIGAFMTPFDASIVAVALPAMWEHLHLSYSQALWAQAAYLLVTSVLLIPAGRLADSRGLTRYYLLGSAVFALGSVVAALSPNGSVMIVGRCIQGAGGAFMFATSVAIVTAAFPARERGKALGLNTMATYMGLTLGPVLGGLIVTYADWRWIFFINVPIAAVTLAAGWTLIGVERRDRLVEGISRPSRRIDYAGTILLGAALVALFVPLTYSPLWGWAGARTIGSLVAAMVLFTAFVVVEDRVPEPMLNLDLLRKNRVFRGANAAALINYMAVFGVTTLTAVFLQIGQGLSAQQAGLVLLAQPVLMAVLSPFTGRLSDRVGSRVLATGGMFLVAVGMLQLSFVSESVGQVFFALGTIGLGMALFSAPNISAVMGSVDRSQLSLASGFLSTMRFTGQGVSIAVLGAIAAWKLGPEGGRMIFLGETGSATNAQAFVDGFQVAMLVGAVLAALGAVISWTAKPEERRGLSK
jgi:EmrB/QacA subfamily drug resistance transporter